LSRRIGRKRCSKIEPHTLDGSSGEASLVQSTFKAVDAVRIAMKIESTVRYLGIEVDDAIGIAEKIDI